MNVNITITRNDNDEAFSVQMVTLDHEAPCEGEDHDIAVGDVAFRDDADVYMCVAHFAGQIVAILG